MNVWQELGITPTRDLRAIKRAYAARLRQVHPEEDAEGFQRLRSAYESARRGARGAETIEPVPSSPALQAANDRAVPTIAIVDSPPPLSPLRAGAELASRFVATANVSAEAIEARLRQLLQAALLRSLVVREQFEQQLLRELLTAGELPVVLTETCIRVLEWGDRRHPLWRDGLPMLVTRFAAARTLERTRVARSQLAAIRAGAQGGRARRNALLALLGPVQPLRYRWLALSAANRDAIAHCLQELPRLGQDFFERETSAAAVAWWRRQLMRPHLSARNWILLFIFSLCTGALGYQRMADSELPLAAWCAAQPLAAVAASVLGSLLVAMSAALIFLQLRHRWQRAFDASARRQLSRLRHTASGRAGLTALYGSLLLAIAAAPVAELRILAAWLAALLLPLAFGRLALRMIVPALTWGLIGLLAPGPSPFDDLTDFCLPVLGAWLGYCGIMLLVHDRLVRRSWSIERIGLWMRGLVLLYWLVPLSVLTLIGALRLQPP